MMTLAKNYIGFTTILRREIRRTFRAWMQNLLPPAVTSILYFLIFGRLIGPKIGALHGVSYIQYIAPGLIMMNVIMSSYSNTSSSLFFLKFQRSIEELLVSPLSNQLILLGLACGGIIRGIIIGIIVSIITLFFTHVSIQHIFLAIIVTILSAMLFSLAGIINGIIAKTFDDIALIPTFVLTPLTYLGGVFYSINMLPTFWQHISMANPILYMVDIFRYSLLNITEINIYFALGMIILCNVVLFCLCSYLLNKGTGIRT